MKYKLLNSLKTKFFLAGLLTCFALLNFALLNSVKAEEADIDSTEVKIKDTLRLKFDFKLGQKLTYKVVSFDSIAIDYGAPLLKSRFERWEIFCDSISSKGNFFLTQRMIEFRSVEQTKGEDSVERKDSEWLNKRVRIELDSLGNRYSVRYVDSVSAIIAPGGPFHPFILFKFGESLKAINESWICEASDTLLENGFPPAILHHSSLNRVKQRIDTLDYHCNRFDYIRTGQGSVETIVGEGSFFTSVIINAHGILDISSELFVPVHYFSTMEQKLSMHYSENEKIPGWHYVTTNFTLEKNEYDEVFKQRKIIKNGKKQSPKRK